MDSHQKYRLADTLNHLTYPQRIIILQLCLIDNQYNRQGVRYQLAVMRERRWPTERTKIQYVYALFAHNLSFTSLSKYNARKCMLRLMNPECRMYQDWLMQLERAQNELRRIKECHMRMMEPRNWAEGMYPEYLRRFGIIS